VIGPGSSTLRSSPRVAGPIRGRTCWRRSTRGLAAGLVRSELGSIRRFAFRQPPIVRCGIYADVVTPQRVKWHRGGSRKAPRGPTTNDPVWPTIAEHWFRGRGAGRGSASSNFSTAIDYAERAAAGQPTSREAFANAGRPLPARRAAGRSQRGRQPTTTPSCCWPPGARSYDRADLVSAATEAFRARPPEIARRVGGPRAIGRCGARPTGWAPVRASYVLRPPTRRSSDCSSRRLAGLGGRSTRPLARAGPLETRPSSSHPDRLRRAAGGASAAKRSSWRKSISDPTAELIALYGWLRANLVRRTSCRAGWRESEEVRRGAAAASFGDEEDGAIAGPPQ